MSRVAPPARGSLRSVANWLGAQARQSRPRHGRWGSWPPSVTSVVAHPRCRAPANASTCLPARPGGYAVAAVKEVADQAPDRIERIKEQTGAGLGKPVDTGDLYDDSGTGANNALPEKGLLKKSKQVGRSPSPMTLPFAHRGPSRLLLGSSPIPPTVCSPWPSPCAVQGRRHALRAVASHRRGERRAHQAGALREKEEVRRGAIVARWRSTHMTVA